MKRSLFFIAVLSLVALLGCTQQNTSEGQDATSSIKVDSRGMKYIVDPSKILSGGPPKDGIPSIDNPKFVPLSEADRWIEDNELVLAIIYKGVKRVYPLQILVWHEIVNDTIAGDPILITYCPLCGSGIAYRRSLDGEAVEFGTTGKLYNSNLVMYDRKTDTWWTQIDGKAIVGEMTGGKLTEVSIDTVIWGEWKKGHPDSEVLSRDATGIVTFTNLDSGQEIVKERDFWFAWYAFHPDTLVYED